MDKELFFLNVMNKTKILRPPKHTLATFGTTTLNYVLLSEIPNTENQCRLRQGDVTAQRPQILTPDLWRRRFEGFGEEQEAYGRQLERHYGKVLQGLEYTFRNDLRATSLENTPLPDMVERVSRLMIQEDAPRTA